RVGRWIESGNLMSIALQAPRHVRAHPAQSDHAQLHRMLLALWSGHDDASPCVMPLHPHRGTRPASRIAGISHLVQGCARTLAGMYGRERRRRQDDARALREGLTAAQLQALETLEHFHWTLEFVRRPMFQDPVPVVIDRYGERYAVLRADGSLDESPGFAIRK